MNPLTITILVFVFIVWIMGVAWQVGYLKTLGSHLRIRGWRIHLSQPEALVGTTAQVERRSLLEKSRPLLGISLLVGFVWVLLAVALIALTHFRSTPLLVTGLIAEFIVLIVVHGRLRVRYLTKLVCKTPCPKCGNFPMNYLAQSKDKRRLLVCAQCETEWDLGSAHL